MSETLPPRSSDELAEIPELTVGQTIKIITSAGYDDTDRKLTVEDVGVSGKPSENISLSDCDGQVLLSGYGTEYRLIEDRFIGQWQRVMLCWQSKPAGLPVKKIEQEIDE